MELWCVQIDIEELFCIFFVCFSLFVDLIEISQVGDCGGQLDKSMVDYISLCVWLCPNAVILVEIKCKSTKPVTSVGKGQMWSGQR